MAFVYCSDQDKDTLRPLRSHMNLTIFFFLLHTKGKYNIQIKIQRIIPLLQQKKNLLIGEKYAYFPPNWLKIYKIWKKG